MTTDRGGDARVFADQMFDQETQAECNKARSDQQSSFTEWQLELRAVASGSGSTDRATQLGAKANDDLQKVEAACSAR